MTTTVSNPSLGAPIVPLHLGGNTFGWTSGREQSFAVLDAFQDAGGNVVDTADMYSSWVPGHSGGESEEILGAWMAARGNRDRVVIATKTGAHPEFTGLAHDTVVASLEASLKRLRTDHVDLYYAHYDDESVEISDQVDTFDELVRSGKIRGVGLSNYSPARMREFFTTARQDGRTIPVAIQPQYSLVARKEYEQEYRPLAAEFDAAVFSYYSLASGFLTGKYRTPEDLQGSARQDAAQSYLTADGLEVVDTLDRIATAHGTHIPTVALAWLRARGVTAPIASASRPAQLPALLAASSLRLTNEELGALDDASQPFA